MRMVMREEIKVWVPTCFKDHMECGLSKEQEHPKAGCKTSARPPHILWFSPQAHRGEMVSISSPPSWRRQLKKWARGLHIDALLPEGLKGKHFKGEFPAKSIWGLWGPSRAPRPSTDGQTCPKGDWLEVKQPMCVKEPVPLTSLWAKGRNIDVWTQ